MIAIMISIYSPEHIRHDAPHEFFDGALIPAYEAPVRASIIHSALEAAALGPIIPPRSYGIEPLQAVHSAAYLAFLEHAYSRWVSAGGNPAAVIPSTFAVRWMHQPCDHPLAAPGYYTFDGSAPIVAGTYQAARSSANAALTGAELLVEGQRAAYVLCRPPGHHAGSDMAGGYCYLNNAAIAAQFLHSHTPRVAILDIDFHHGNGTQQIFYERADILFVSIHGDPAQNYPYFLGYAQERGTGAGLGYTLNFPLGRAISDQAYLPVLDQALEAIAGFAPAFLVVSVGLDTFGGDPVAENGEGFALSSAAYPIIGQHIAALGLPTLLIQEGGYAVDALGHNLVGLLQGFEAVNS